MKIILSVLILKVFSFSFSNLKASYLIRDNFTSLNRGGVEVFQDYLDYFTKRLDRSTYPWYS